MCCPRLLLLNTVPVSMQAAWRTQAAWGMQAACAVMVTNSRTYPLSEEAEAIVDVFWFYLSIHSFIYKNGLL